MPTPDVNCPLSPHVAGTAGVPQSRGPPTMGVFIIDLPNLKGPLSKSLQRVQTFALWIFAASFKATAWVQLAGVTPFTAAVQYAGFKAFSKNGCGVTAPRLLVQPPPAKPALPPQNCITIWP